MKRALVTLVTAGCLATAPMCTALASNDQYPQSAKVVELKNPEKVSKEKFEEVSKKATKADPFQGIIMPELIKSPNYSFTDLKIGTSYKSPQFYHSSGDILVTLVQWDDHVLANADLLWAVETPTGTAVAAKWANKDYTSESFTINFGNISAGNYVVRVYNPNDPNDLQTCSGNFFIYY